MGSVVDGRRALQAVVWGKPTVSMPRKAAVLGARGRGCRTPPGSRGHVGEPDVSGAQDRPGGAGAQRPWRERGLRPVHAPVRETTNHRSRQGTRDARDQRRVPRGARWPSERSLRPTQVGPCGPNAPWEGRRRRDARGAGRTDGRAVELTNRHTTPPAPGRASPTGARSGDHDAGPPHRRRLAVRGLPPTEARQCAGHRRGDGASVGRTPRRDPTRPVRASASPQAGLVVGVSHPSSCTHDRP